MLKKAVSLFSLFTLCLFLLTACNFPGGTPQTAQPTESQLDALPTQPDQGAAPADTPQAAGPTEASQGPQPTEGPVPTTVINTTSGPAILKITGEIENEISWSLADLTAKQMVQVESAGSKGTPQTVSGVSVVDLINQAKPTSRAEKVIFIGKGGSKKDYPIAQILSCQNCILTLRGKGGLGLLMPGIAQGLIMKDVVEIQLKGNGIP